MELLTADNIAEMLKLHVETVWKWTKAGRLPQPEIRGTKKFTRWHRTTIENWIKAGCEAEMHEASR